MLRQMVELAFACAVGLCMIPTAFGQPALLPNGSFEEGKERPAGWQLGQVKGAWENQGHSGRRSISVTGTGEDTGYWRSDSYPLAANEVYRITFWTKTDADAQAGCITTGTSFTNRDFQAGPAWEKKTFLFKNPVDVAEGFVRFGQWMKKGRVWFDDVEIHRAIPHHLRQGDLELGGDEAIQSGVYRFRTRLGAETANYSRPEVGHTAHFNSDRWCFGDDQYVLYKFALGPYRQTSANLTFNINHYTQGEVVVEASVDEKAWAELGQFKSLGKQSAALPSKLLPAAAVWVRFTGKGTLQINNIEYEARLEGAPPNLAGATWLAEPVGTVKDLDIDVVSLGDALAQGRNEATLRLTNKGFWGRTVRVLLESGPDGQTNVSTVKDVKARGFRTTTLTLPYKIGGGVGVQRVALTVSDKKTGCLLVTASQTRTVTAIGDASFGYRLPGPDRLGLWWAEATYKIGRTRALPTEKRDVISIAAARNEYEPFQLVLCSTQDLKGVTFDVGEFRRGDSVMKGSKVRIETVEYVPVEIPTDFFGCAGDWPDPLAPCDKPVDLAASRNQPVWFTVCVPEDAAAGEYEGSVKIMVQGEPPVVVPIRLKVWDFALSKDTHTKTAYGVGLPSDFLGLKKEEDRVKAHDLYMQNCAEHRISPYHPMALAPWKHTLSGPAENPEVSFDFTEFDKAAHRYLDEFRFNAFDFGGIPGNIGKLKRFTPEFNALFKKVYGPYAEHLRRKGWLDKAYCYWFDEPEPKDYPTVVAGMKLLAEACPGLARLLTEQPEPDLYDMVDIWVPVLSNYDPIRCHERQRAGQQVWWYVCCGPRAPYPNNFIDHPAIAHRIRFWMMQKFDATGSLYWSTTYYRGTKGVVRNPWKTAMSYSPTGGMWGNGDGMLLYPPVQEPAKEPTIRGPYNSIRWEMLREGLEDREYFWTLEQAIAEAKKRRDVPNRQAYDQLISEAQEILNFPDSFITDLKHYTKDAQDLYALRAKIAEYIERLASKRVSE